MPVELNIPGNQDPLEYLVTFAQAFDLNEELLDTLLGTTDSLRQAKLIPGEPLGLFACQTAQEEAASFLYYALLSKGHNVPDYGRIQRHQDKVKVLLAAKTVHSHFFELPAEQFPTSIRLSMREEKPEIEIVMEMQGLTALRQDPFKMVVAFGDGEDREGAAIDRSVKKMLSLVVAKGDSISNVVDKLAKERNHALYGNPKKKPRMADGAVINQVAKTCQSLIVLGLIVLQGSGAQPPLNRLLDAIYMALSPNRKQKSTS